MAGWPGAGPEIPFGFSYLASTLARFASASWKGEVRLGTEIKISIAIENQNSLNSLTSIV